MAHSGRGRTSVLERQYLSPRDASKLLGVEPQTISAWANVGAVTAIRTAGGHRRFLLSELQALRDGAKPETKEKVIVYCRSSSYIQKENGSLQRQIDRTTAYAKEKYRDKEMLLFSEIGSGFSAERKQLWAMLDRILLGELDGSILCVQDRDRLSRFIVEVFEKICERHNIKIEYLDNDGSDEDKTFSADLIACVTYWTVRYSAKKSGKRQAKPLTEECIKRGLELISAGNSTNLIHEILTAEGFTASKHTVRKYILEQKEHLLAVVPPVENTAQTYRETCTTKGNETHRLLVDVLWADYQQWCEGNGKAQLTKRMFLRQFSDYKGCSHTHRDDNNRSSNAYIGLIIKDKPQLNIIVRPQQRKATAVENLSLENLLKFSDTLKGKTLSSKKLQFNYQQWCKVQGLTPMKRAEIFRHIDRLALSKKINGHLFTYSF